MGCKGRFHTTYHRGSLPVSMVRSYDFRIDFSSCPRNSKYTGCSREPANGLLQSPVRRVLLGPIVLVSGLKAVSFRSGTRLHADNGVAFRVPYVLAIVLPPGEATLVWKISQFAKYYTRGMIDLIISLTGASHAQSLLRRRDFFALSSEWCLSVSSSLSALLIE
jgi:hypothetical protein